MTLESTVAEKDGGQAKHFLRDDENAFAGTKELVGKVRHDLNNALTGILGQTQLLLREELGERARHRVEVIEALALRIRDSAALLRDIPPTPRL